MKRDVGCPVTAKGIARGQSHGSGRDGSWLLWMGALLAGPVLGCGGRTTLYVIPPELTAADAGAPPPAGGGQPSPVEQDAGVTPCGGAPWVLFSVQVFDAEPRGIYARHPDGAGGHFLTLPHGQGGAPSVSADGLSLLYTTPLPNTLNAARLFLYDFGAASDTLLAAGRVFSGVTGASLANDGASVVVADALNLYVSAADASGTARVVDTGSSIPEFPAFTKDGQGIVFTTAGGPPQGVDTVRLDGSGLSGLVATTGFNDAGAAAFSPDFSELAAIVSCDGTSFDVRIYPFASLPAPCETGRKLATLQTYVVSNSIAWGPGGVLAYTDGYDVLLVDPSGAAPVTLTSDFSSAGQIATHPTWAPACTTL